MSGTQQASTGTLPLFLSEMGRDSGKAAEIVRKNNSVLTNQRSIQDPLRLQPIIASSTSKRHSKLLVRCGLPAHDGLVVSLFHCCCCLQQIKFGELQYLKSLFGSFRGLAAGGTPPPDGASPFHPLYVLLHSTCLTTRI